MRLLCLLLLWTSDLYAKEDEEKKFSLHKLFTDFKQYRTTFFYQHIFAIGRPVKLPCFQKGHGPKQGVHTYNWTHQGYLISDASAFISAHLDSDGNLLISQILARKLTIWCTTLSGSLKALKPQNFAHRIDFYDPTFRQTLIAIDIKVNITQTERSNFAAFAFGQQFNCQVRSSEEPGQIPEKNKATEVAPQKKIMLQTVRDACSKSADCIGVSLDFFRCSIDTDQLKALYSFDLSLLLTNDFGSILLADSKVSNVHEQNAETLNTLKATVDKAVKQLLPKSFGLVPSKGITINHTLQSSTTGLCLGAAGKIDGNDTSMCRLCGTGSLGIASITLPPPPEHLDPGRDDSDEPFMRSMLWPNPVVENCRPCPAGSYIEEMGHPVCLACPPRHHTPIFGEVPGEGGEWLHTTCPARGRNEVLLEDFVTTNFGTKPGKWFARQIKLTRVALYASIAMTPLWITLLLLFIMYYAVDVGAILARACEEVRPLQLQAAELMRNAVKIEKERRRKAELKLEEETDSEG